MCILGRQVIAAGVERYLSAAASWLSEFGSHEIRIVGPHRNTGIVRHCPRKRRGRGDGSLVVFRAAGSAGTGQVE